MTWQPIETASHGPDAPEVLVGTHVASVWIVRNARWVNADEWVPEGDEGDDGWWSYKSSVTQEKLEGYFAPQWWMPMAAQPKER